MILYYESQSLPSFAIKDIVLYRLGKTVYKLMILNRTLANTKRLIVIISRVIYHIKI